MARLVSETARTMRRPVDRLYEKDAYAIKQVV